MTQEELISAVVPVERLSILSREELEEFYRLEQDFRRQLEKENRRLRALTDELKERSLLLGEQYVVLKPKKIRVLLPSERYPEAPLIERRVEFQEMPGCKCCGAVMSDSGMTEDSEFLTVIPEQYLVIRQMRQKVRCTKCYGDLQTVPAPHRIKEGSSYSDEMMVDVAMTKYCDLIPVERYSAMAGRGGLEDLPPHSLIESTHYLADFANGAYEELKKEISEAKVLHADETPHRMLEGSDKSRWYLWGFSTPGSSYYECHGTRSGDVASELLKSSKCEFLVSDVFSGYGKAVRDSNEERRIINLPPISNVYCNAHARRKFKEAVDNFPEESAYFIERYQEIYKLEAMAKEKPPDEVRQIRCQMQKEFDEMRDRVIDSLASYSSKSSMARAMKYYFGNFDGLTMFLKNPELPIDNNSQERLMRNPVIGRKTWYGTHSKRGAKTAAILFSLVESCRLNKINPRLYFKQLVADIHSGKAPYTPSKFQNPAN